jgi:hypothetical protein
VQAMIVANSKSVSSQRFIFIACNLTIGSGTFRAGRALGR